MPFNSEARRRLQKFVTDARAIIERNFTEQLQGVYGMDPVSGRIAALHELDHLGITAWETASDLREILNHYKAQEPGTEDRAHLRRILREQTQTFLHRICALRMAEERGVFMESLARGMNSAAMSNYRVNVGSGLGGGFETYVKYLKSLFDELSADLPQIFDRTEPFGQLFLEERPFMELLEQINASDLESFWREDETIGWIFQYFNNDEDFSTMRGQQNKNPRNSHELAVRNQFFTPRYVVEFLLDNTLGRVWAREMHGETRLLEKCRFLVNFDSRQSAPSDRPKDPRTIRVLDPACGSMHFGLYAFDLLETIYEEAWDWLVAEDGRKLATDTSEFEQLNERYASKRAFLEAVPALIIQHNLHGVDIDVRATQIASLALWLRAQKSFSAMGLASTKRPSLGAGNVVAALAPPAEADALERIQREVGRQIDLAAMFENLRMVPETGILMPLERSLSAVVKDEPSTAQPGLFAEFEPKNLWERQREALGKVLAGYQSAAGHSFKERLYARNASECLRLIDVCKRSYDVIVMNPPFGSPADSSRELLGGLYPLTKREIIGMFVLRMQELLARGGFVGTISSRTIFFQSSSEGWRELAVFRTATLPVFADLGPNVMDNALVESAAYVLGRKAISEEQGELLFLDVTETESKGELLAGDCRLCREGRESSSAYWKSLKEFQGLPGKVLSYKADQGVLNAYENLKALGAYCPVKVGIQTGDNNRYVRLSWESENSDEWHPLAKGGEANPFYGDVVTTMDWVENGSEVYSDSSSVIRNSGFYFRTGLTWTLRANSLSLRIFPEDGIFDRGGSCVFSKNDGHSELLAYSAILNSRAYQNVMGIQLQMSTGNSRYECGMLAVAPIPDMNDSDKTRLAELAESNFNARRRLDSVNETSHAFLLPMKVQIGLNLLDPEAELRRIAESQIEMDREADRLYGFTSRVLPKQEKSRAVELPDESAQMNALLSWAVGVAFGRFDRRLASEEREVPPAPGPFEAYPKRSPGRLPEGDAPFIENKGVFVMDPGHRLDLAAAVHAVLDEYSFIDGVDVEAWLRKDFFPWHLKEYSAAQRVAPIYWPIGTTSGSYVLWLYYPAFNDQTLFVALNDFIDPKIKAVAARADEMRKNEAALDAKGRKLLRELTTLAGELSVLRDEVEKLARTYVVHFDDGVAINASRFRSLIQSKAWCRKLDEVAEKLRKGELDWSETAADLWHERVQALCRKNRSVALAHRKRWPLEGGKAGSGEGD